MLIKPCRAVHTVGMSFPIDVAFLDRENRICFLLESLPPFRFSPAVRGASCVIEAPAGTFRQHQTCEGDLLESGVVIVSAGSNRETAPFGYLFKANFCTACWLHT